MSQQGYHILRTVHRIIFVPRLTMGTDSNYDHKSGQIATLYI